MSAVSPTENEVVTAFCNLTTSQQEQIINLMCDLIKSNRVDTKG